MGWKYLKEKYVTVYGGFNFAYSALMKKNYQVHSAEISPCEKGMSKKGDARKLDLNN